MSEITLSGDSPAQPTATPSAPVQTPTQSVTPSAQATPSAPSTPTATPPEGYVPSYRLRETREALDRQYRAEVERVRQEQNAEADRLRSQIRALTGVAQPPSGVDAERDAVRQQFAALYPDLDKLNARASDLLGMVEKAENFEQATAHHWESYGRAAMDRLYSHAAESLGGPLTEEAKRQLHTSFSGWVSSSPELSARYAQDPSIVEDFWKQFTSNFVDPVRRTAQSGVAARAGIPVPQDSPAGAPRVGPPPAQPDTLDGRASLAWARFNELRK